MKKSLLIIVIALIGIGSLKAQDQVDAAKAKFIYNFTKFFDWPQSDRSGDFLIGVLGSNNIYHELSGFTRGKKVILQDIKVQKFRKSEEVTDCHLIYISRARTDVIPALKQKFGKNTLFISDSSEGIDKGAALNFLLIGNKLKFEFAASNARSQGLQFSSRIRDMAAKNY